MRVAPALLSAIVMLAAACSGPTSGLHAVLEVEPPAGESAAAYTPWAAERIASHVYGTTGFDAQVAVEAGNRIRVDIPGYTNIDRFRALFDPRPTFELRLVDDAATERFQRDGTRPIYMDLIPDAETQAIYAVRKRAVLSGEQLVNARADFDPRTGQPVVSLTLDRRGTELLAAATRRHINTRLAIVLAGRIVSAPVISEPILGGRLQISGDFTLKAAEDLALILRESAMLPSKIRIVELRVVPIPH